LEKAIAGGENRPETWCAYAQRLTETSPPRFAQAALAYRKVLEKDPYHRQARVGCALALAQAWNADELHAFLRELIYSEPKLAVDLFDRPECRAYLAKERFVSLQKEARAQAMD
jgi:tetratricopeptide (TPR) repeat protein